MPIKKKILSAISRVTGLKRSTFRRPPIALNDEDILVRNDYVTLAEIARLKSGPHASSVLLGKTIGITDSFWYLHSLKEIFAEEVYRFRSKKHSPYILDCGSNIGLSVIYFKRLFPRARVIAFEPDKDICGLLQSNLHAFSYDDVTIENKAVWQEDTMLNFAASGSLGGRVCNTSEAQTLDQNVIEVPAVALASYLKEEVEFLKMDIEGPEVEVLASCTAQLHNVQNLFVEYHSKPEEQQQLDRLLSILKQAGFRVYLKEAWNNLPFPYLRGDYNPCYDLQLNIFAYRVKAS